MTRFRRGRDGRWEGVEVRAYDEDPDAPFRGVTRQRLFGRESGVDVELRYFEVEPGGWSSLERHEHAHAVVILRGRGQVLVDPDVREVAPHDLVHVPPRTWHQLRAGDEEPLGFLCWVNPDRDRPERPDESDLEALRANPDVARFVRT